MPAAGPQNGKGMGAEHFVIGYSLFGVLRFMAIR